MISLLFCSRQAPQRRPLPPDSLAGMLLIYRWNPFIPRVKRKSWQKEEEKIWENVENRVRKSSAGTLLIYRWMEPLFRSGKKTKLTIRGRKIWTNLRKCREKVENRLRKSSAGMLLIYRWMPLFRSQTPTQSGKNREVVRHTQRNQETHRVAMDLPTSDMGRCWRHLHVKKSESNVALLLLVDVWFLVHIWRGYILILLLCCCCCCCYCYLPPMWAIVVLVDMERIGVTRNLDGACDDQATTAYGNPNHNNTIIFKILTTSFSLIVSMNITTATTLVKGWVELFYVKGSPLPLPPGLLWNENLWISNLKLRNSSSSFHCNIGWVALLFYFPGANHQQQFLWKLGIFPENVLICQGNLGSRR